MIFAIQLHETVQHGFVRVLAEMSKRVGNLLTKNTKEAKPEDVHETRVLIKRLRALLWFVRPTFASADLTPLESHLRKAAHLLSTQRDEIVMESLVAKLTRATANVDKRITSAGMADFPKPCPSASLNSDPSSLPRALAILKATIKALREKAQINSRWPLPEKRLAAAFHDNKAAGEKALLKNRPLQFHEWRKKTKRLLYQLELTQPNPGNHMTQTIGRVDELQDKLGKYHDCSIVRKRLKEDRSGHLSPRFVRECVELLEGRQKRLRKAAQKISQRIKSK